MINEKDFNEIKKSISEQDLRREELIKKSRDVIRLSKQVIYSVHRDELDKASLLVKQIKKEFEDFSKLAKKSPELLYSGAFKVAVQEYVEAVCFFNVIKNKKLINSKEFNVSPEYYLLGICDLTGELVRRATNCAIKGDYEPALFIRDFVEDIYNQFLAMDLRNGELRKKFDGMRYDLKRLEDLALSIKFKK